LFNKGLWSNKEILKLQIDGTSSAISDDGSEKVYVDSIDNLCKQPVSYIKMDVEGSEYEALKGARKMISSYTPKLAVCVYHKQEDIWEIPKLIHELNPSYRMYFRHYSFTEVETVLYAV
jgi:hypothetical protein